MGNMDLEINILSKLSRETQAVRSWLCALPSFYVHLMAEPGLGPWLPHLQAGFSFASQHASYLELSILFLGNFSPTKEVIKTV